MNDDAWGGYFFIPATIVILLLENLHAKGGILAGTFNYIFNDPFSLIGLLAGTCVIEICARKIIIYFKKNKGSE